MDDRGHPLPWYTYPCIQTLESRLSPTSRVFEWGSGHSTLWFAQRVREIVTVEHDLRWVSELRRRAPAGARFIHHTAPQAYAGEILHHEPFDLIVVDGRYRPLCGRVAAAALTTGGVILWDDSQAPDYPPGRKLLRRQGFQEWTFSGYRPGSPRITSSTLLLRSGNCLNWPTRELR